MSETHVPTHVPPTRTAATTSAAWAAADLRALSMRYAAGECFSAEYMEERNRIRSNWSKASPPQTNHCESSK